METGVEAIGSRIMSVRKSQKLSRKVLADMVGRSANYLKNIEYGDKNPSVVTLSNISKALNTSVDYLIHGKKIDGELLALVEGKSEDEVNGIISVAKTFVSCMDEKCDNCVHNSNKEVSQET